MLARIRNMLAAMGKRLIRLFRAGGPGEEDNRR